MSVQDYIEQLRQPMPDDEHLGVGRARYGRTVGDGIAASAKIGGLVAIMTILAKAGPFLFAAVAALLFSFRGCSRTQYQPQPAILPFQPQTQARPPRTTRQPVVPPIGPAVPMASVHNSQTPVPPPTSLPSTAPREVASTENGHTPTPFPQVMPGISEFNRAAPSFEIQPSWSMQRMLVDPRQPATPMSPVSPLFDMWNGRVFAGTSQLPGRPSERTSLTILEMRDRGTNITARLSLIEKPTVHVDYRGCIEQDELILRPAKPNTKFGAVRSLPWHGCPCRITLTTANDGKTLSGTSSIGERFEFLPRMDERPPQITTSRQPSGILPTDRGDIREWQLTSRNGTTLSRKEHVWLFRGTSERKGSFVWYVGGETKSSGSYRLVNDQFDLKLKSGVFHVFAEIDEEGTRVCVPGTGKPRPTEMSQDMGIVFELQRITD